MKRSILKILNSKEFSTFHYKDEDEIIKRIDELLENNKNLTFELCNHGQAWMNKRRRFKYNMKIQIMNGLIIKEETYVYLSRNYSMYFLATIIEKMLSGKIKKYNDLQTPSNDDYDEDPFSERSIMRDLMRGEGYKHGLD